MYIVTGICLVYFLLGIAFTTNGGIHLFTIFDDRCTSSLLFVTFLEVVIFSWNYGMDRFFLNLREMHMIFPWQGQ